MEDIIEHIRRYLLFGITPRLVRIAVALYDESVKTEVHRLLTKRSDQFSLTAYMTRVADDGQVRDSTTQLNRNLPHRQVAVDLLVITGESAGKGSHSFDTRLIDTFHTSEPEVQVVVDGILDQDRDVDTFQGIG